MHSAGIVVHDGCGRLLLGLQRGGWSSFSGKSERAESPKETARRECDEETLFVLRGHIAAATLDTPLVSTTPSGGVFHLYFLQIPHIPNLPRAFDAARRSGEFAHMDGCAETKRLSWFTQRDLPLVRLRVPFRMDLSRILECVNARREAEVRMPLGRSPKNWHAPIKQQQHPHRRHPSPQDVQ